MTRTDLVIQTTLTCPACGHREAASMPTNACVQAWPCPACGEVARPQPGDCCVFCSYADDRCPPEQEAASA